MENIGSDAGLLARVSKTVASAKPQRAATAAARKAAIRPRTTSRWVIPGILGPTHITTSFGEVPAHLVRVRDRLRTRSGNFVPVLRVDAYRLDPEFLDGHPDARPVKVIQGSLGHNMPDKDAWYSPQQMILSATSGETHRLVPACEATNSIKATTPPAGDLAYYVFHLGQAALVRSEGMWISLGE